MSAESRANVVPPRFRRLAAGTALLAIAFAGSAPARAQNWNLYGGYNSLPAIPFAYGPMSTNNGASVMMTMTGANPTPFVMDTGSTGILVSPDNFKPGPNDVAVGTGSQFYSSSGLLSTGTFYVTDVAINNTATAGTPGPNGTQPIAGAALATARVTVLLVTNQICTIPGRNCTPSSSPTGVAYMGVGFDRGSSSITPPAAFNNTNPFINIVSLASGNPISTLRPGYLITNGGVTLGLSNTADVNNNNPGSNFAFVKLTPNTPNSGQPAPAWQQAPMAISVGGVTGSGAILPDAGINYSYLTPPPNAVLQTISCPPSVGSGNCINPASGAQVQVFLPGQSTTQPANFSYTLGTTGNPINPNNNVQVIPDGAIFLNTGREFYQAIDYIYDPIGGFVGYAWASTTNGAIGQVTPSLSLIGGVALQDGFANSLPTFLMGGTTLLQTGTGSITSVISGAGGLTIGSGQVNLTGANTYFGGTTVTGGATLGINADSALGDLSGGLTLNNGMLLAGADITTARAVTLGAGGGAFNTNGFNIVLGTAVTGVGGLIKNGLGVLTLEGANTYTGGTTVAAGTLNLTGTMIGSLSILAGATFTTTGGWALAPGAFFSNAGTFQSLGGGPLVNQGMLINNGTMTTDLVNSGRLSGIGTINGTVTNNGIVAPGNSIGTLSVVGSYTQAPGSFYQVETNSAGQADLINVTGAPGTATINGGTVTLTAATGVYAPSTTYTILTATGGVTGTYAGTNSLFPFLQPSLSYDVNNVYLTLKPGGFARGAQTANQSAVGRVLDQSVAGSSGDFATVIGTLAPLSLSQGQAAMAAISGQNYSGFGAANLGGSILFMNALGQQMSAARGTGSNRESRTALALACDVACDAEGGGEQPSPWSIWGSAMGGTGTIAGNANTATLTYNAGGVATGVDYRFDPRFMAGIGVGFASGSQWASGFSGQGTTNSYQASLYAAFTQAAFYLDGLAGYGYNDNQMTRQIVIPGLVARNAQGRTGANQLLGQVEAGYRIAIYEPAAASLTPFARVQATTVSQMGFSENGAGSLNLNVAPQTTGSARSVLGAELASAFGAEGREKLAMQLRLGWAHEYANTARPVTANFAGAPGANFTVFGAAPQRDAATVSLAANTAIAAGTSLYLRYDGEMGTGTSSHSLNGGLRLTW